MAWICWQALGRSLDVFWSPFPPWSEAILTPSRSPWQQDAQVSAMQAEMLQMPQQHPRGGGLLARGSAA